MFYNCKGMNTIPMIMALTAGPYCCDHMFDNSGVEILDGSLDMTLAQGDEVLYKGLVDNGAKNKVIRIVLTSITSSF